MFFSTACLCSKCMSPSPHDIVDDCQPLRAGSLICYASSSPITLHPKPTHGHQNVLPGGGAVYIRACGKNTRELCPRSFNPYHPDFQLRNMINFGQPGNKKKKGHFRKELRLNHLYNLLQPHPHPLDFSLRQAFISLISTHTLVPVITI